MLSVFYRRAIRLKKNPTPLGFWCCVNRGIWGGELVLPSAPWLRLCPVTLGKSRLCRPVTGRLMSAYWCAFGYYNRLLSRGLSHEARLHVPWIGSRPPRLSALHHAVIHGQSTTGQFRVIFRQNASEMLLLAVAVSRQAAVTSAHTTVTRLVRDPILWTCCTCDSGLSTVNCAVTWNGSDSSVSR